MSCFDGTNQQDRQREVLVFLERQSEWWYRSFWLRYYPQIIDDTLISLFTFLNPVVGEIGSEDRRSSEERTGDVFPVVRSRRTGEEKEWGLVGKEDP